MTQIDSTSNSILMVEDTSSYKGNITPIRKLIEYGTDIAGNLTGAAIGFLLAGPDGAIAGGVLGSVVHNLGNDIAERLLSRREEVRLGAVISYVSISIKEKFDKGLRIREDDFFTNYEHERSSAQEITEGILLAAQREYEEKKIQFYGSLLASISFSPEISRSHANLLIRLSESLSYRQLCILAIVGQKDRFMLRRDNYRQNTTMPITTVAVLSEVFELEQRALINSGFAVLGMTDIIPAAMNLEGQGKLLFTLMELSRVDQAQLITISALIQ